MAPVPREVLNIGKPDLEHLWWNDLYSGLKGSNEYENPLSPHACLNARLRFAEKHAGIA